MSERDKFMLFMPEPEPIGFDPRPNQRGPDVTDFMFRPSYGGWVERSPERVLVIDWPEPGPGAEAMRADGWAFVIGDWHRSDGGMIRYERHRNGRYANRLPTNRNRKRQAAKARRRARRAGST